MTNDQTNLDIEYLTKLCRIECSLSEQASLKKDLTNILGYIQSLNEVDTSNVKPCIHVLESVHNIMRDDIIGSTMSREAFLENAPQSISGMIRVPLVLKNS